MKKFKTYLAEMPYIEIGDQITDLELEKIKDKEQFITFLKYLFSDKRTPKDKYDLNIEFKSSQDRERFKKALLNNKQVLKHIKKFGISGKKLSNILKEL